MHKKRHPSDNQQPVQDVRSRTHPYKVQGHTDKTAPGFNAKGQPNKMDGKRTSQDNIQQSVLHHHASENVSDFLRAASRSDDNSIVNVATRPVHVKSCSPLQFTYGDQFAAQFTVHNCPDKTLQQSTRKQSSKRKIASTTSSDVPHGVPAKKQKSKTPPSNNLTPDPSVKVPIPTTCNQPSLSRSIHKCSGMTVKQPTRDHLSKLKRSSTQVGDIYYDVPYKKQKRHTTSTNTLTPNLSAMFPIPDQHVSLKRKYSSQTHASNEANPFKKFKPIQTVPNHSISTKTIPTSTQHQMGHEENSTHSFKTNTIEAAMKGNMSNYFESQIQHQHSIRNKDPCNTPTANVSSHKKLERFQQRKLKQSITGKKASIPAQITSHRNIVCNTSAKDKKNPGVFVKQKHASSACKTLSTLTKATEAQRIKDLRHNKSIQAKEVDKAKDKYRKSIERINRSRTRVEDDKIKDTNRKRAQVQTLTDEEQQVKKLKWSQNKSAQRANRTSKQIAADKTKDKNRKQIARKSQTDQLTVQSVLSLYKKAIQQGPTYPCSCCSRLLYRRSVVHCVKERYKKFAGAELNTILPTESQPSWICMTCHNTLKRGRLPAQATANQLGLEKIPEVLSKCCSFETQLISKVICFQKIFKKPRGAQHGIKGQAVLVPADLSKVSTCLPRPTSDSQFIALALKRRLSDKHEVNKQFIRPGVVNDALSYLKANNIYYSDVEVNSHWQETSANHDKELWTALTDASDADHENVPRMPWDDNGDNPSTSSDVAAGDSGISYNSSCPVSDTDSPKDAQIAASATSPISLHSDPATNSSVCTEPQHSAKNDDEEIIDSEDEVELGNPSEFLDNLLNSRQVNNSTCIYPTLGPEPEHHLNPFTGIQTAQNNEKSPSCSTQATNKTINIAPGEGKIPLSRAKEPGWEAMAHPVLHPTGTTTYYTPTERKTKLSSKKYVNARLLHKDGRFAESTEFCFSALDWIETEEISSSISITARKRFQEDITVGDLRNPDRVGKFLTEDQMFATFKRMKGTPQAWKQMNLDMLAKLRQLGPYTFFITGNPSTIHIFFQVFQMLLI